MENAGFHFTTKQKIYLPLKRFLDIVLSFLMIVLLSPLYVILFFVVLFDTKAFPIFRQIRMGKDDKRFVILKFRTMKIDAPKDVPTHQLHDSDMYTTRIGKFLRKASLDELPQAFNVFIGNMSFVGPRPALYNQYDLIAYRQTNHANKVRPGLTGLAQCNGRDSLSVEEKAALDGEYVKTFGFFKDIALVFKTFGKVLKAKDVIEGEIK